MNKAVSTKAIMILTVSLIVNGCYEITYDEVSSVYSYADTTHIQAISSPALLAEVPETEETDTTGIPIGFGAIVHGWKDGE